MSDEPTGQPAILPAPEPATGAQIPRTRTPYVVAIVPAAGSGQRLGANRPKALVAVGGEPLLGRAVAGLVSDSRVRVVVVAAPAGFESDMADAARSGAGGVPVVVITGGATRADSVAAALRAIAHAGQTASVGLEEEAAILVHDAARCLTPGVVVSRVIDAVLAGAPAVVPAVPVVDTVRQMTAEGSRTLDRSALWAVQTPQGFAPEVLREAHARGGGHATHARGGGASSVDRGMVEATDAGMVEATDDAGMVEALGIAVTLIPGDDAAFKITTARDLLLADAMVVRGSAEGALG